MNWVSVESIQEMRVVLSTWNSPGEQNVSRRIKLGQDETRAAHWRTRVAVGICILSSAVCVCEEKH